ncbi:MAG: hypothetical protein PHW65_04785 [Dehalococcoidales bacterium]|nr:hypothetical protein [Dehalococcoidales bacterium]
MLYSDGEMERLRLHCHRCGYEWYPIEAQSHGMPKTCPKCRSPYWWKERTRASGSRREYYFDYNPSPELCKLAEKPDLTDKEKAILEMMQMIEGPATLDAAFAGPGVVELGGKHDAMFDMIMAVLSGREKKAALELIGALIEGRSDADYIQNRIKELQV